MLRQVATGIDLDHVLCNMSPVQKSARLPDKRSEPSLRYRVRTVERTRGGCKADADKDSREAKLHWCQLSQQRKSYEIEQIYTQ
jgi:hypothetical protein